MADQETVSALEGSDVTQVRLDWSPAQGWQASIGKGVTKGYTVAIHRDPGVALFEALHRAGVTNGANWKNPNPLRRLENALDRLIIALGGIES